MTISAYDDHRQVPRLRFSKNCLHPNESSRRGAVNCNQCVAKLRLCYNARRPHTRGGQRQSSGYVSTRKVCFCLDDELTVWLQLVIIQPKVQELQRMLEAAIAKERAAAAETRRLGEEARVLEVHLIKANAARSALQEELSEASTRTDEMRTTMT